MTDHLGPLEFVAVEFPSGRVDASGFEQVLAQAEAGSIFVLDIELVVHPAGEPARTVLPADLPGGAGGLELLDGASTGLLDADDIARLGADLDPTAVVAVLVYEDRTMERALDAWEAAGGRLLAEGTLDETVLNGALGADDAASATAATTDEDAR